jgi:hypothetical protein
MPIVDIKTGSDADYKRTITWRMLGGPAIDLTGHSLLMHIRASAADARLLFEASTDNGFITFVNPAGGVFTLWLPYSFLRGLPAGTYVHSMVRKNLSTSFRSRVWSGAQFHKLLPTRDNLP